jgi:hypothetical protein
LAAKAVRRDDDAFFSAAISPAEASPAHALRSEPAVNTAKRRHVRRDDFLMSKESEQIAD